MLEPILNSKAKIKILRFLVNRPKWIFIESEIARELFIPRTTAHRVLKELRDQNIIKEIKKGKKVIICQLNKSNYIVKELLVPLFQKEYKLPIEKARRFCKKMGKLIKVGIVFGSAAEGKMQPTSDIDIALITNKPKETEAEADELKKKFLEEEGIIFSSHIFSVKDFKKRYSIRDPFIKEVANGIVIFGNIEEVI